jgi:glycosidase
MPIGKRIAKIVFLCISLFSFVASAAAQSGPQVTKVEPPNWWANHSINPVRVLLRGSNLTGARVEAIGGGIRAGAIRVNPAGTYLFVDLTIDKNARPGNKTLRLSTNAGQTSVPFEISEPLARAGHFQGFSPDDVIYLIMPDRFADGDPTNNDPPISRGLYNRARPRYYHGGDFRGIIQHLPYLRDLGVTAIWMTPWYDNANRLNEKETYPEVEGGPKRPIADYHGYGAVDFYGVDEHLGNMATLRELIETAHKMGIKVIQDQVCNHTGPYHPWVEDSPTPTWYHGTVANHPTNPFQPWMIQDPNAKYEDKRNTLDGWFIDILPDMNQSDPEVARYEIQNTLWWADMTGIDAIRQDTWPYVPRSFWRDWMAAIKRQHPTMTVVGEMFDADPALVSFFQGGRTGWDGIDDGVDSMFDFPLLYTIRQAFAEGKPIKAVAQELARDHLYPNAPILVTFIGNHDMPRFMNEPNADITGLKLAQTFLLTTRGIPQLYYGDELAMKGGGDPENRRDFPGGFPGDDRNAFTEAGRNADENEVFNNLRRVLKLRSEIEPLRRGSLANLYAKDQQYAFARVTKTGLAVVIFNNDKKEASFSFDVSEISLADGTVLRDRLASNPQLRVEARRINVTMAPRSAGIFVAP